MLPRDPRPHGAVLETGSSAARRARGVLALATLVGLLALAPMVVFPYFEDTALVAAVARWKLAGARLYVDVFDHKLPVVYWEAMLRVAVFGRSSLALRAHELFSILLCAFSLSKVTAALAGDSSRPFVRGLTVVCTACASSTAAWQLAERGQVEMLQLGWISASAAAALASVSAAPGRRSRILAFAAGAALAWASAMKPQALAAIPGLVWALGTRRGEAIATIAAFGTGILLVALAVLGGLFVHGEAQGLWELVFEHQPAYLAASGLSRWHALSQLRMFVSASVRLEVVLAVAAVGAVATVRAARADARARAAAAIVFGLAFYGLAAFVGGRFGFWYHAIAFIPSVSMLFASGAAATWHALAARVGAVPSTIVGSALGLALVVNPAWQRSAVALGEVVSGERTLDSVWDEWGRERHYYRYGTELAAARQLNRRSRPGDELFVAGLSAVTYLEARPRPACRHLVTIFAHMPGYARSGVVRDEIARCLDVRRPRFILVRTSDIWPWFGVMTSSLERFVRDPVLGPIMERHYRPLGTIRRESILYERCSPSPCASP
ncbi:MAG: hypothetical protein U0230_07610 [Polyangiales bacterium]